MVFWVNAHTYDNTHVESRKTDVVVKYRIRLLIIAHPNGRDSATCAPESGDGLYAVAAELSPRNVLQAILPKHMSYRDITQTRWAGGMSNVTAAIGHPEPGQAHKAQNPKRRI